MHEKKLYPAIAAANAVGQIPPEGVSFDGVNDYLSRSSDLVGNANGKTFTVSCWVYHTPDLTYETLYQVSGQHIRIYIDNSDIGIKAMNSSASSYPLDIRTSGGRLQPSQWNHVLVSIDMDNESDSKVYINDSPASFSKSSPWSSELLYLTGTASAVGSLVGGSQYFKGRLCHLYLDYAHRDLSIEANRRLFITEDLKPAEGLASLNPILYLPMRDAETAYVNEGTGGDFIANGVLDTAQRGPNQNNCAASEFDGGDDWLGGNGLSSFSSTAMTLSFYAKWYAAGRWLISNNNEYTGTEMNLHIDDSVIRIRNSSGVVVFEYSLNAVVGRAYSISLSFDLSDQGSKALIIDGEDKTSSVFYNASGSISYATNWLVIGRNNYSVSQYFDGGVGEVYLDAKYIPLSSENPFWDAGISRHKPVRLVLEETGNTPIGAYPISADNAGLNLGLVGALSVYGGGLKGARGMSEFVSRSVKAADVNSYLYLPSLPAIPDGKKFSFFGAYRGDGGENRLFSEGSSTNGLVVRSENQNDLQIYAQNAANTVILSTQFTDTSTANSNEWRLVFVSIDMSNHSACYVSTDRVGSAAFSTFTDDMIDFTKGQWQLLSHTFGYMEEATAYFVNDWVDFSNEEIRNMFVDQLGYPKDLSPAIESGEIPQPIFYLKFEDPDDLGLDSSGNNNHFTVNGTVTPGADFNV